MMRIRYVGYIKKRPQPQMGLRPLADVFNLGPAY